jgi:hypothetical protein
MSQGAWVRASLLLLLPLAVLRCSPDRVSKPFPNHRPGIRITGGPPVRADGVLVRDSYLAHISWRGWDEDGVIDRFEYAIDVDHAAVDTNHVTGNGDGDPWAEINDPRTPITWTRVGGFDSTFVFRASTWDSTGGLDPQPAGTARGDHAFYLRAVDDREAASRVEWLAYTATTIAPRTTIHTPRIENAEGLSVGPGLFIAWEGEDPDASSEAKAPRFYEYKLIQIPGLLCCSPSIEIRKHPGRWIRVGADTTSTRLQELENGKYYAFAVRAVDEAGAVEPGVYDTQNAFKFQVLETAGLPTLTVNERTLGSITCVGSGSSPVVFEVLVGTRLRFELRADASAYGGLIGGCPFNWGVDLADPSRDDPDSGWRGWRCEPTLENFPVFTRPGTHYVYLRVRDSGSPPKQTVCILQLEYRDFPRDRGILYIDDSYTAGRPTDADQDEFHRAVLDTAVAAGEVPGIDVLETYGTGDHALTSAPVGLETLAHYRLVVWNTSGEGRAGTGISAWRRATTGVADRRQRILPQYLSAGGQLWVFGTYVVGATMRIPGPFVFPDRNQLKPGNFAYDFLRMTTTRIEISHITSVAPWDGMVGATPCPGSTGAGSAYPPLRVDPDRIPGPLDAFPSAEAVFAPFDPGAPPGLDTLYCYEAYGPAQTPSHGSVFQGKPCAFRYASRAPVPEQGKVAYFGFPLEYFDVREVKALAARLVAWFDL